MKNRFTHRGLYAIVDSTAHEAYGIERLIRDIVEFSEIPVIQFRFKKISSHKKNEIISLALELKSTRDFALIMNDDIEFMSNEKIDGLHLGQTDIAFGMAKKTHPEKIMGLSTHNLKQALDAVDVGADYIGCGTVFPSSSKENTLALGLENLKEIVTRVPVPKVAIGGIQTENISDVAATGCEMAAVISALVINNKFAGQKLHETFLDVSKLSALPRTGW